MLDTVHPHFLAKPCASPSGAAPQTAHWASETTILKVLPRHFMHVDTKTM